MWKVYALLSAVFAAATAILAKIGVKGIDSNLATAIRTTVILAITWGIAVFAGTFKDIKDLSRNNLLFLNSLRRGDRPLLALLLQSPAARRGL